MNLNMADGFMDIDELLGPCGWVSHQSYGGWRWVSPCGRFGVALITEPYYVFGQSRLGIPGAVQVVDGPRHVTNVKITNLVYGRMVARMRLDSESGDYMVVSSADSAKNATRGRLGFVLERELLNLRAPMLPL